MTESPRPYRTRARDEIWRAVANVAAPYHEPPSVVLRRRVVVGVVLLAGAVLSGFSMTRRPGELGLYWLTLALAAVWVLGALVSGPVHLGGICWRGRHQRPVISGTVIGLLLGGVFVAGGLIAREIGPVSGAITRVLQLADHRTLVVVPLALANAIGEEMYFRGGLYTALGRHYPVTISTIVYVGASMTSANPMLGFAAVILGTVCAWERRCTGGVLASVLTHVMWSLVVVLGLAPLFGV